MIGTFSPVVVTIRAALARIMARLRFIMRREPWWAEFWSGLIAVAWAVDSVAVNAGAQDWPSMSVLTEIADDQTWHVVALVLGVTQIVLLVLDYRWPRWVAALALCWFWGVMTVGVYYGVPGSPMWTMFMGWCGINLFSILRLLRHHGG